MTAAPRTENQFAIFSELLRWILPAARREVRFPALLQQRLARDRRFGSRDRRIYRALAYSAIRFLPWLEAVPPAQRPRLALWLAADETALAAVRPAALDDWPPVPASLAEKAAVLAQRFGGDFSPAALLPDWFAVETHGTVVPESLFSRPPLWIRLQAVDTAGVFAGLRNAGIAYEASPLRVDALALRTEIDATATDLFRAGAFEVQDLGSQLILALARPDPGTHWLDACAGAGGKTLQLAGLVGPAGHVDATDLRTEALTELGARAARAGLKNVAVLSSVDSSASYDGVLVDAPCSGSGTWRRHPHLKWQTSAADLRRQAERQFALLARHAGQVRAGGLLVYATCSLARTENAAVVERFLGAHPNFQCVPPTDPLGCATGGFGTSIHPHVHNTDGFFVSTLTRTV